MRSTKHACAALLWALAGSTLGHTACQPQSTRPGDEDEARDDDAFGRAGEPGGAGGLGEAGGGGGVAAPAGGSGGGEEDPAPVAGTGGTDMMAGTGGSGGTAGSAGKGGSGGTPMINDPCMGTRIVCDDFESGKPDLRKYTLSSGDGATAEIATGMARSGKHALRVHIPKGIALVGASLSTRPAAVFPNAANAIYGRVYVHAVPADYYTHAWLINAEGKLGTDSIDYRIDLNKGELNARYDAPFITEHGGLGDFGAKRTFLPSRTWSCLSWHFDGLKNRASLWLDDKLIVTTNDDRWMAPRFVTMEVGFFSYQQAKGDFDVWYDDLVLDDEPIPCD